jgi:brassinosteroid-6-oxidase 2
MMAVKYLHDHPTVLQELRVSLDPLFSVDTFCHIPVLSTSYFIFMQKEHLAVREKKRPEDPIDLNDLKPMRFTRAVSRDYSGR